MNLDHFKNRWIALFPGVDDPLYVKTYYYLRKKYSERFRKYHNFNHIISCLNHYDTIKDKVQNPFSLEFAIWFHDVIYRILGTKNEIKSAVVAENFLKKINSNDNIIKTVFNLILDTRHISEPKTIDGKYMIDIDLAVLGSSESEFIEYENKIRKEYFYIPYSIYKKQRIIILDNFIQRENIYYTNEFSTKYNSIAKKNIMNLINKLK